MRDPVVRCVRRA